MHRFILITQRDEETKSNAISVENKEIILKLSLIQFCYFVLFCSFVLLISLFLINLIWLLIKIKLNSSKTHK